MGGEDDMNMISRRLTQTRSGPFWPEIMCQAPFDLTQVLKLKCQWCIIRIRKSSGNGQLQALAFVIAIIIQSCAT